MNYLCNKCCDQVGIHFSGDAVNEVGRKRCASCGDTESTRLHILPKDFLLTGVDLAAGSDTTVIQATRKLSGWQMNDILNRIAEAMSLEFMRDNLEKIRHCVATDVPIIIKDGELIDTTNDGPGEEDGSWAEGWEERCKASLNIRDESHKLKTGRKYD